RAQRPDLSWKDHAVLVRHGTDLERIGADLEVAGIPVRYLRPVNALASPVIRDLLAWIELVADPAARHAAQRLLSRPPLAIGTDELSRWMREYRMGARRTVPSAQGEDGGGETIVEWLARVKAEHPAAARLVRVWREAAAVSQREGAAAAVLEI